MACYSLIVDSFIQMLINFHLYGHMIGTRLFAYAAPSLTMFVMHGMWKSSCCRCIHTIHWGLGVCYSWFSLMMSCHQLWHFHLIIYKLLSSWHAQKCHPLWDIWNQWCTLGMYPLHIIPCPNTHCASHLWHCWPLAIQNGILNDMSIWAPPFLNSSFIYSQLMVCWVLALCQTLLALHIYLFPTYYSWPLHLLQIIHVISAKIGCAAVSRIGKLKLMPFTNTEVNVGVCILDKPICRPY